VKKQTAVIFYVLAFYVALQFAWWGYHLIELTQEVAGTDNIVTHKVIMITGEGLVFFLILSLGLWRIRSAIKRDQQLTIRQSNFLLSVTHELKTPLASTKLYLQTLMKREFPVEKRNELLQKALLENLRLEEIVEAILTASRIENGTMVAHKEWISLNDLLTELATSYNNRLEKEWVTLELDEVIHIEADLFMTKTILINLVENALKYAGTNEKLTLFLYKENQNSKFGVKDLGPGISKEAQADIFKKFVRLENEETRSQKGTGLGLFIAAEFTKLIGGKIQFKENQPKGAIFEITV
jgi:two-component system, OmpR family, phosphate regulon sensor histidine kinase PhoR